WSTSRARSRATSDSRCPRERSHERAGDEALGSRRAPEGPLELPAAIRSRGGGRGRLELPPPLVPGQGLQALARLDVLLLAGDDQRGALPAPLPLRLPATLPLHPLGGAGLRLRE